MAMGHGGDALRAATLAAGRIRALLAHPEIRWGGRSTIASAPQGAALQLSDLGCRQDERWLLQGVNLAVEPGEWLAIVGASGSGKSTLLRLIARYSEPDSGTVSCVPSALRRLPTQSSIQAPPRLFSRAYKSR
ncbi:MAG: ATP-binding cassette domain-containing protein [Serratia marcescens]|nr:ATP-binding cassette domain-containing protein [Serratia marcescens]